MRYKYTNPNTGRGGIVDAETYQRMLKSSALKGYVYREIKEPETPPPPPAAMPAKFQTSTTGTKKPRRGKSQKPTNPGS